MQGLLTFLVRLVLLAAGLVVAASLAVVVALALAAWGVRYAWARLTGRAVSPFVVHMRARRGFEATMARRPAAVRPAAEIGDITDVQAKPPRDPA
jgi:hypothetical protein